MKSKINENVFVMTRPQTQDDVLMVHKIEDHQKNQRINKLYDDVFNDYFLNLDQKLSAAAYKKCVSSVVPTMALLVFQEMPEIVDSLNQDFLASANASNKNYFNDLPDHETRMSFILNDRLAKFRMAAVQVGLDKAVELDNVFFELIQKIFYSLPASFMFSMVDVSE